MTIKEAQFNKAVQSLEHPGLALGGTAQLVDMVLFFVRKSPRHIPQYTS